ncbi:hypothetical protein J1N35_007835 [Gossypium stocksii]|uniref:Uncharacterized protein n=1 Tax=Gossypium stocksii TaxID=47602 RepID=A0A9D3W7M4_9ROSI|nr:hypothetical protein J1N35_007835 [Gossypium stocksii]
MNHEASQPSKQKFKKKSSQNEFYERYINGDPSIGPLGEDNCKFLYLVNYFAKLPQPIQNLPTNPKPSSPPKSSPPPAIKRVTKPKKNSFPQPCYKKIPKWVQNNPLSETTKVPEPTPVCMYQSMDTLYDQEFPPLQEFAQ